MTWSQPLASARSAFALEPTVPMTWAPSALAHWHASKPMPPAAAWIRTRWCGSPWGAGVAGGGGPAPPPPRGGEKADAAGRGMDQDPMVRLDLECLVQEVPDRQPLQHQDGALLAGEVVRQLAA